MGAAPQTVRQKSSRVISAVRHGRRGSKGLTQTTFFTSVEAGRAAKRWFVIDATDLIVGRLASVISVVLQGKHKATFTPHVDDGDNVVVVNAEKVRFTGRKIQQKKYYHYSGFQGGIKERSAQFVLEGRFPERVVEKAVERMLPRGPLGRKQLGNLRVYKGPDHPHGAQRPELLDIASLNEKNVYSRTLTAASHAGGNQGGLHDYFDRKDRSRPPPAVDSNSFSRFVRSMDVRTTDRALQRLVLLLDNPDPRIVGHALIKLSLVIPRLDLQTCLRDAALRRTLRTLPDRLMKALSETLETSHAAKDAALALVAAIHPDHYAETLEFDEQVVCQDLEGIFEDNDVHSFLTIRAHVGRRETGITASIWNGLPFELDGRNPTLAPSNLFEGAGLEIDVAGAATVSSRLVPKETLSVGQFAGVEATLAPARETDPSGKVIVDLRCGGRIYSREVFDPASLFPSGT